MRELLWNMNDDLLGEMENRNLIRTNHLVGIGANA